MFPPAWRERTPVCPKNPPSPRTGTVLHNSHPPGPQVPRTPPASSKPHGPVLPTRPPWAPPALLGGEALHTPPTPQAGPSHAYSHHPHAGRDVQRVDGDAVEEARDCTSWRQRHRSGSWPGEATQGDGSRRREKPFRLSPRLSSQHPDTCPRRAGPSEASTRLHGPRGQLRRVKRLPRPHGQGAAGSRSWLA